MLLVNLWGHLKVHLTQTLEESNYQSQVLKAKGEVKYKLRF